MYGAACDGVKGAGGAMLLLDPASALHARLAGFAERARAVFVAGLPGTGKSLLIHQLAQLAQARGRAVSLLQWDVARPAVETHAAARAYPARRGVTHGVVRVAVGRWARGAVARWAERAAGSTALLVGEVPLVGHRLIELTRPLDDAAEAVLSDPRTRFVIPVPSPELRRHLEAERARRTAQPLHPREREDAPPEVLRDIWHQLTGVASTLGLAGAPPLGAAVPYDPALYTAVYQHVLRHRHVDVVPVDAVLSTAEISPYDLGVDVDELRPRPDEAERLIAEAGRDWADPAALEKALDLWYLTP
jgi:hypothetical protein